MGLLHGRAGRLTSKNGGFRPGQCREELLTWFCHQQLQAYHVQFEPDDPEGVRTVGQRFSWLLRHLAAYEERYGDVFPRAWDVTHQVPHAHHAHSTSRINWVLTGRSAAG